MTTANQIFVNLQVKDLKRSMEFFEKLGFEFNMQFTDKNAACLILGENMYAMLLTEVHMKQFTRRPMVDAKKSNEVLTALAVENKEKVNEIARNAVRAGGKLYREPEDLGWMYTQAIEDLDGHIWEIFYMDEDAAAQAMIDQNEGDE
jgi:hypothetical protein